jgi:hypothetical protein
LEPTEIVSKSRVIGVSRDEYKLDDDTSILRIEDDLPLLEVGDIIEISTDGQFVYWGIQRS